MLTSGLASASTAPSIGDPILEAKDLVCTFQRHGLRGGRRLVHAVQGVTLQVYPRETLGIVGESGCGKTTLARALLGLIKPTGGDVLFEGRSLGDLGATDRFRYRRHVQAVFQDPVSSLNPRKSVGRTVGEIMRLHGFADRSNVRAKVCEVLDSVGLPASYYHRMPHQLSGGQRQRVAIAKAVSVRPVMIVADEALSALDMSIQAQILQLLEDLRSELGVSYVFISHDLDVVREIADRVVVMYLGRVVESGTAEEVMTEPRHPYTRALLASRLLADPRRAREPAHVLAGDVSAALPASHGCPFHPRCPEAMDACRAVTIDDLEQPSRPGSAHDVHLASCIRAHDSPALTTSAKPL